MKRFINLKQLKRLNLLHTPQSVRDISEELVEDYEDKWLIQAEKIETKRLRAWRHQLAQ